MPRKLRFLPTKATFKLGDRLGVGTVGVVYQAESPDFDHPVAIKLLHPNVSGDEQIVNRFEREVMIMERLHHPNIVGHYGGGMLNDQLFYAMEMLSHGSLKDRLKQHGPMPWAQVAAYGAQIASALQHAHNHGIIHRDLKPSNLFFGEDGRLLLGDFGIALDTEDADITDKGVTVGTYAYMSPEQITADREISGKADIYSLGCVMYEMLTGHIPFRGHNFAQVWEQHLHKQPEGIRAQGVDCPEWLEELVMQMLAKDPEERPFNARAVQGRLRQHLLEEFGEAEANRLTQELPPLNTDESDREQNPRVWALWVLMAAGVAGAIWAVIAQQQ